MRLILISLLLAGNAMAQTLLTSDPPKDAIGIELQLVEQDNYIIGHITEDGKAVLSERFVEDVKDQLCSTEKTEARFKELYDAVYRLNKHVFEGGGG